MICIIMLFASAFIRFMVTIRKETIYVVHCKRNKKIVFMKNKSTVISTTLLLFIDYSNNLANFETLNC